MAWLDSGWKYRKSITLSRASGAVTNYQMMLLVGESSGATGENVDCSSRCLPSFNDLRFTKSDGTTLIDYWIESISGTTPNQLATIWIEFDSIGTSDTSFFMYYGNSKASLFSNGDNTFVFFDHFDKTYPGIKWNGDTSYGSISNSIFTMTVDSSTWRFIYSSGIGSNTSACRFNGKFDAGEAEMVGFKNQLDTHASRIQYENTGSGAKKYLQSKNGTTWSSSEVAWTSGVYKTFDILKIGGTGFSLYEDGSLVSNKTDYPSNAPTEIYFQARNSGHSIYCDWILIRQYLPTEPVWGTWGAEEIIPKIFVPFRGTSRFLNYTI